MRYLFVILFFAATCARGQLSPGKTISDELGWSFPPITNADPSIRHPVAIQIPIRLKVALRDDWLIYGFDEVQTTNIMVGHNMVTGVDCEAHMDCDGVGHPLFLERGPDDLIGTFTNRYNMEGRLKALLENGTNCVFEYQVTVFETDIPGQHHWQPKSGKLYKVLWTRTFRKTLK